MRTATYILFLALMMSIGCATKSRSLVVAYGRLMDQHDNWGDGLRVARYRISVTQRGSLGTNVVQVVFWQKTQVGVLPQEAILLLSRPRANLPVWHAYPVGEDASRGILPDTPANRLRIASLPDARIMDNPKRERLPRSRAEQILRDYLQTQGVDMTRMRLRLRRAEFGWKASICFPDEHDMVEIHGDSYLGIRDCGDILYWRHGL